MVQMPNRLEFPTESYDDFSGQWSAERMLFRILFLLRILRVISKVINRLVFCYKQVREKKKYKRNKRYSLNRKKFQNYPLFLPPKYIIL
jgi:hypothetical protein